MARSSNRISMFSSNRGRVAKRWLIVFTSFGIGLFFINGILAGPVEDDYYQTTSFNTHQERTPTVSAPIARPFAVPVAGGAEEVRSGDIYGNAVERPDDPNNPDPIQGATQDEAATDELQRTDSYQSAVTLVQKLATAYGTYSPAEQTAQEWVDSLPGLEASAKESLLETAESVWPRLLDREVTSEATPVSQSVQPIYSRNGGATIQLSVSVTKNTSYEGEERYMADAYAVTLQRSSDVATGWIVVAIE